MNGMTYAFHKKKSISVAFLKVILKDFFILMDRDCLWIMEVFQRFNEAI